MRVVIAALYAVLFGAGSALAEALIGSMPYTDHRDQPPYLPLNGAVAGYRLSRESRPIFLHDGRARSANSC